MADTKLETEVALIKQMVKAMHDTILGNGQPGALDVHAKKIDDLKAWKNKATGAIEVIGFFVGTLGIAKIAEVLGWIK